MKAYQEYKESKYDWIDKIPKHWNIVALKFLVSPKITDGPHESPEFLDEGVPFVSAEAVQNGRINFDSRRGNISREQHEIYSQKCLPQRDDIFLVKSGATTGKMAYVDTDMEFGIWSPLALIRANKDKAYSKYLFQALGSKYFQTQVQTYWSYGTQPNIGMGVLENLRVILPSIPEQQAIADFLERKTAQIDTLIAKKQRQIDLLHEQRTALINHAVTKGLNPKVKMKDSGVEWLREIPSHWEVSKVKFELDNLDHKRIPLSGEVRGAMKEKTYDYYGASGVIDKVEEYLFDETLILLGEDGANLVTRSKPLAFLASGKYWVNNHAHILKPKNGNIEYLVNILEAVDYFPLVTGAAQPKLTAENLANVKIPIPPIDEQNTIMEFLNKEDVSFEKEFSLIQKQIELLQEYRTALISEAVTGKVDVRTVHE